MGVRLGEVIAALSLATDLGSGQPLERALRRCLIAVYFGEALGLDDATLRTTYYLALLQYIGCTAEAHQVASVYGDEIAAGDWFAAVAAGQPAEILAATLRHVGAGAALPRRAGRIAATFWNLPKIQEMPAAHCEVGRRLAERLGLSADVQVALGQVYERWDGKGLPGGLKGEDLAVPVRLIKLAQDAEIFYALGGIEAAIAMARQRAGAAHDPRLVEDFCREAPRLFDRLAAVPTWDAVLAAEPGSRRELSDSELDTTTRAIADFADLKSPYFAGHSSGVATLAAEAARRCRLPESEIRAIRRAGLLHDLGRVGISAGLWGKTGPLTASDWERIRLHPYYTERILARLTDLAPIGALAGHHHERLNGSGYYRGVAGPSLTPAARLIAAADVYQALTEPRPHRPAQSSAAAADTIRREVQAGRLDGEAADAVLASAGHRVSAKRRVRPAGLSEREVEVLRLLARGLSNRQMAQTLTLAERTVHHHVQHIYGKLGVSTRAGATLFAIQNDLFQPTD